MIVAVVLFAFISCVACQDIRYAYGGRRHRCCGQVSNVVTIGHDNDGNQVNVDVGRCSTSCGFDYGKRYRSVLERILERKINKKLAFSQSQCTPFRIRVDNIPVESGSRQVEIVESCAFRKRAKACTKVAKLKTFFTGTEFETTVDVGECQGACRNLKYQKRCQSSEMSAVSIQGPNGVIIVDTINKCKCEKSCYRQHFNTEVKELMVLPNGQETIRTKVVDVGKCTGSCSPIRKCVMKAEDRESASKSNCLMALETNDVKCAPVRSRAVSFINEKREVSYVNQVKKCGCV